MAGFIKDIAARFRRCDVLMKIIIINVAVFLVLRLIGIIAILTLDKGLTTAACMTVELPASLPMLLHRPWTLITYMFAQVDVMHILFNMLWLYWFGSIFTSLTTVRRLLPLYIYGGLGGAILFIAAYNSLPYFAGSEGLLIGSSAAVIAIVTATAFMAPDYKVGLLFLGPVSLKWIAAVTIGIDFLSVTDTNAGGHIAHLGGALTGMVYIMLLRRGTDLAAPFNRAADSLVNHVRRMTDSLSRRHAPRRHSAPPRSGAKGYSTASAADAADLDTILDKIKKSGYSSLTAAEKKRLFDVSNRIR